MCIFSAFLIWGFYWCAGRCNICASLQNMPACRKGTFCMMLNSPFNLFARLLVCAEIQSLFVEQVEMPAWSYTMCCIWGRLHYHHHHVQFCDVCLRQMQNLIHWFFSCGYFKLYVISEGSFHVQKLIFDFFHCSLTKKSCAPALV